MKTKKLILGALLVVLGTSAQAQIVSSQSNRVVVSEQEKPKEPMKPRNSQWYVKAGISSDQLIGNDENYDDFSSASLGYDVSFGFIKPTKIENLFWGTEFGVMSIGSKIKYFDHPTLKKQHAITISPFVGYDVASIESVRISPYLGAYLSYALNSLKEREGQYIKIDNNNSKLSGGFNVGVGFWIGDKFNVDVHYRRALLKSAEAHFWSTEMDTYSQKIVFGLGMAF